MLINNTSANPYKNFEASRQDAAHMTSRDISAEGGSCTYTCKGKNEKLLSLKKSKASLSLLNVN